VIGGQKLTINHPSLVDEEEIIRVLADGSQKREGERDPVKSARLQKG